MSAHENLFRIETNHVPPDKGSILVSEPFLHDYYFGRSVVLLVEHDEAGSMGLVLNKPLPFRLNDILDGLDAPQPVPVFRGGPLGSDHLCYLHGLAGVGGAQEVARGLFLNGDLEAVCDYVRQGNPVRGRIRFFLGYSGWEAGQLDEEIRQNTWMVSRAGADVLSDDTQGLWGNEMGKLGDKYRLWTRFPMIPAFN